MTKYGVLELEHKTTSRMNFGRKCFRHEAEESEDISKKKKVEVPKERKVEESNNEEAFRSLVEIP